MQTPSRRPTLTSAVLGWGRPVLWKGLMACALVLACASGASHLPGGTGPGGTEPQETEPGQASAGGTGNAPSQEPNETNMESWEEAWAAVDELVEAQQLQAALDRVEPLVERARSEAERGGEEAQWSRSLIAATQLRIALHGYETSVRALREAEWPRTAAHRGAIQLTYAAALRAYLEAYDWEIRQRERTVGRETVDLKAWTAEQVVEEIHAAFGAAWAERASWGTADVGDESVALGGLLGRNGYPERIRGTMRDRVSHLWADHLANSSWWTPKENNAVERLELEPLIAATGEALGGIELATDLLLDGDGAADGESAPTEGASAHPLERAAAVLADLQRWHRRAGRVEAAMEAERRRVELVWQNTQSSTTRQRRVRDHWVDRTDELDRSLPWWSRARMTAAEMWHGGDPDEGALRAHQIATTARDAHPQSVGGRLAAALIENLEAPQIQIQGMWADGPNRRSIELSHRNLEQVHFRAWAIDLEARLTNPDEGDWLVDYRSAPTLMTGTPDVRWTADLPPTPDFRVHRTFVTPAMSEPGLYLVAASVVADPGEEDWQTAFPFLLTDLVMVTRNAQGWSAEQGPGGLGDLSESLDVGTEGSAEGTAGSTAKSAVEVRVLQGDSGRPVEGAEVVVFRRGNRRQALRPRVVGRTDAHGTLVLDAGETIPNGQSFLLLARHEGQLAYDSNGRWMQAGDQEPEHARTLLYTDRSVYRPGQELHWKVVAFEPGEDGALAADYDVMTGAEVEVTLVDANGEQVEQSTARTNGFGSASGTFRTKPGRMLGNWSLRAQVAGQPRSQYYASVRVEEYKRPTFEVTVDDPDEELRLDTEAELVGSARYYFGLPVDGSANWRVTREPVYPWWWTRWRGWNRGGSETIAQGVADIDTEGRFRVRFLPEAGEDAAADADEDQEAARRLRSAVSYRYRLSVDVTDEGGETRSAERSFLLGFVTVRATIGRDQTFYRVGQLRSGGAQAELTVRRTDLDGVPRAGSGTWRLVRLEQPDRVLLPADLPALPPEAVDEFTTPGDRLRPRQETQFRLAEVLRSWEEGEEVARGALEHGANGTATVDLADLDRPRTGGRGRAGLRAGAYRLLYSTEDAFGAAFETQDEFLVVDERRPQPLALPAVLLVDQSSRIPGDVAHVLVHSGLDAPLALGVHRGGELRHRIRLDPSDAPRVLEIPIDRGLRGGFGLSLDVVADHQLIHSQEELWVPWSERELQISFETFRDLLRPGQTETWRVKVRGQDETGGAVPLAEAAEVLAYMYDRSLDVFGAHSPPQTSMLQPRFLRVDWPLSSLQPLRQVWQDGRLWSPRFRYSEPSPDRFDLFSGYAIGGPGARDPWRVLNRYRGGRTELRRAMAPQAMSARLESMGYVSDSSAVETITVSSEASLEERQDGKAAGQELDKIPTAQDPGSPLDAEPAEIRTNFSETAFWEPHLIVDPSVDDGTVSFEFTVPDAVTEWNVWVHGLTRDLRGGALQQRARTAKDLLIRPYLPRFLREGDAAELVTVVSNSGEATLDGQVAFDIVDPVTEESLLAEFGLDRESARRPFRVEPGGSVDVSFAVTAPARVGLVAFRVVGSAADLSDGELRPIPVLPGRFHLIQSRFTALDGSRGRTQKTLRFDELAAADDGTRINQQLVVTLDAQLFYSVLSAVPYLVDYPYECTEQTLNRFLSTGILSTLFGDYPAVADMAQQLAARETRYEAFDGPDANRSTENAMLLEETPWLQQSRGRDARDDGSLSPDLIKVLDPQVAATQQTASLRKLLEAQNGDGGFPWWTNGRSSPYLTLYVLDGLSRALEFGVQLPGEAQDAVRRGWAYLDQHYRVELFERLENSAEGGCCVEFVTYLNYVFSNYELATGDDGDQGDQGGSGVEQWTGGLFDAERRAKLLDYSFTHWRRHSPRLKAYLALTLHRAGRSADADLVFASIMDSAKTDEELGTYWAAEERSWLWYRDTVESHAFILRALTELDPDDERRHGLVQWLFLEKKLSHWKSTRATAEAIYALIHYLDNEGQLGQRERATVEVGDLTREFLWLPNEYTGAKNQVVVPAESLDTPAEERAHAEVTVTRDTPGLMFASATWHFSTERLPAEAASDFFGVERAYFLREQTADGPVLRPLSSGARIAVGDEVEVQLSLRSRHDAEYVHLRDPRAAGFEPVTQRSGWSWDLGIPRYEEVRDSGTNFFIERLPVGEYTLKYRIRASVAGTFKVAPATVQSMYAPEFAAYSSGTTLRIEP